MIKSENITIFGKSFDTDKHKIVVVGYRSDFENGFDFPTTTILLEQFAKHSVPCWTEKDLLKMWRQELYRKTLINDVQGVSKLAGNSFENALILRCKVESGCSDSIGHYATGTATVFADIVDGNTGQIVKAISSSPMGTTGNPGWLGETRESAERNAIQAAISETMAALGIDWWTPSEISKLKLEWGEIKRISPEDEPTSFAFFENFFLYSSSKGCHCVDLNSGNTLINVGNGPASALAVNQYRKKMAVARGKKLEIWKMQENQWILEKESPITEQIFRLKFSRNGDYLVGMGREKVFRWNKECALEITKNIKPPIFDIAVSESGKIYMISGTNLVVADTEEKVIPIALQESETWTKQSATTGALSSEGFFSVSGIKKMDVDFTSGATAKHILRVADIRGTVKEILLPDAPDRTRTPQQITFFDNNPRFFALAVRCEANREGYLSLWDVSSGQVILTKEFPKPVYPTMLAVSGNGRYIACLLSKSKNIEIYEIR